ncbi:MAG: hypothetical protein U9N14_05815, partial [Pseudomonadota bacterium]|nr:hypothetical protein [Pseudomonadota bacterium]
MTITTTSTRCSYTGDGITTAFPVTFPFMDDDEIEVIERVIATGVETAKILTTDYTVTGGSGSTGTVTVVGDTPASTVEWHIRRLSDRTQETDYTENDPFPAETHERALDRLVMLIQEIEEKLARALKIPKTDVESVETELAASISRANRILGFDVGGNAQMLALMPEAMTVSTFIEGLLDDETAAAARSTLELGSAATKVAGTGADQALLLA